MMTKLCRIGRDAELRTAGDTSVIDLALAYNYGRKGDGADGRQPTQWIKATLWGKRAESLAQYLKKGGQVLVSMDDVHLKTREHSGVTYNDLCAKVIEITLVGGSPSAPAQQTQQRQTAPRPAAQRPAPAPAPAGYSDGGFSDDDIPFAPLHHRRALRFL